MADRYDQHRKPAALPFDLFTFEKTERWERASRYVCKVENGWLVGYNKGEWGGAVYWFAINGVQHYKISNDQVIGFVRTQTELLAPQGLAHLSLDYGNIVRFFRDAKGNWRSETWLKLSHAPRLAVITPNGSLALATTHTLERIRLTDKHRTVLLSSISWAAFAPNSIAFAPSGDWFIGMGHGVIRFRQTARKPKVAWLLPNMEFVNTKQDIP